MYIYEGKHIGDNILLMQSSFISVLLQIVFLILSKIEDNLTYI